MQTYDEWELIIIDDCSNYGSYKIAKDYSKMDNRISCYRLPENLGAGFARNVGLQNAKGKYIAFIDSDDV